jgi:hypothetical protein
MTGNSEQTITAAGRMVQWGLKTLLETGELLTTPGSQRYN